MHAFRPLEACMNTCIIRVGILHASGVGNLKGASLFRRWSPSISVRPPARQQRVSAGTRARSDHSKSVGSAFGTPA